MPSYLFVVHDNDSRPDPLGRMQLMNDHEAMTVGRFMIRELTHHQAAMLYAGWEMDVTKGRREVGRVPFHSARPEQGKAPDLATGDDVFLPFAGG